MSSPRPALRLTGPLKSSSPTPGSKLQSMTVCVRLLTPSSPTGPISSAYNRCSKSVEGTETLVLTRVIGMLPEFKFHPHRGNCSHTTGIARMKDVLSHVSWHQIPFFHGFHGTSEAHCASLSIWSLVIPMGLVDSYINDGHAGALLAKSSNQL